MHINLLISGGLYNTQAAYSAYQFAQSALAAGHTISQVFFYQDGATHGTALSLPLSDEFNAVDAWSAIAQQHSIPLVACISAAERRGIVGDEQASEAGLKTKNLHSAFVIEGLGSLQQASFEADRTVTFK